MMAVIFSKFPRNIRFPYSNLPVFRQILNY